jgi:hypothetical protein
MGESGGEERRKEGVFLKVKWHLGKAIIHIGVKRGGKRGYS